MIKSSGNMSTIGVGGTSTKPAPTITLPVNRRLVMLLTILAIPILAAYFPIVSSYGYYYYPSILSNNQSTPGPQHQLPQCNVVTQVNCLPTQEKKISIGLVKPTFTAAAYNNAFYSWYSLAHTDEANGKIDATRCYLSSSRPFSDPCETLVPVNDTKIIHFLTGKIPQSTDAYNMTTPAGIVTSRAFGAYDVLKIVPHLRELLPNNSSIHVITDGDVNDAPTGVALNKAYDILILGHQEYVTQKEYDNLKAFVANGGTLVCLDGNIFYAQVTYNKAAQTVTFVRGHGYYFDGKTGWDGWTKVGSNVFERWGNETSQWLGSNFYLAPYALVKPSYDFHPTSLNFTNNPFGYHMHEEQYITNPDDKILMDYGAVATIPQGGIVSNIAGGLPHPIIATYEKNYGKGNVIVFGIYGDEVLSNPKFLKFFDNILSVPANVTSAPTRSSLVSLNFTNATGTIASFQNNQLGTPHGTWSEQFTRNGIWLLSGIWSLVVSNPTSTSENTTAPTFDASFSMVMLNGTAMHKHKISVFTMIGNPITNSSQNSTTLKGTATVTMKDGPHTNVPISITITDKSVIRIAIDQTKTDNHFGLTPIFGSVAKLG